MNDGDLLTDSFVYTVSDGNGGTDTATLSIEVEGRTDVTPTPMHIAASLDLSDTDDIIFDAGGWLPDFLAFDL